MDLANQLGVSRVPAREAIRMLDVEGLDSTVARGGVFVASLSLKDVQDFFDIREALEALVAKLEAERITAADERRIRAQLEDVRHLH